MQTNFSYNCPKYHFGSYRPTDTLKEFNLMSDYIGLKSSSTIRRGFEQFVKEQAQLELFDVKINPEKKTTLLINNLTNKVEDIFVEGFENSKIKKYPGRKLLDRIFNPKNFLPRHIILAGEKAKQLETEALKLK